MASVSLLENVAQHEKSLMADLDRAREEARQVIESAHAKGAAALQESNARLDAEIAALRRDAAQEREEVRTKIQREAAEQVEAIRRESAERTAAVREDLLARILPNVTQ